MKKNTESTDWLRPEYTRADLGKIVRGKYAGRIRAESNVVVLDPIVAKVFPNDEAVNSALRGLIHVAQTSARNAMRASRKRRNSTRTA
jgi:hypothetical protein